MKRPALVLAPQRCDKCMRCMRACRQRAIEVAAAFVFIDWSRCDGCGKCVPVCEAGAISWRGKAPASVEEGPRESSPPAPPPVPVTRPAAAATGAAVTAAAVGEGVVRAAEMRAGGELAPAPERRTPAPKPAAPRLRAVRPEDDDPDAPAKRPALDHLAPLAPQWEAWEVGVVLVGVLVLFMLQQAALGSDWMARTVPLGAKPLIRSGILTLYYAGQLALLAALGYRKRVGFTEAFGLRRFKLATTALAVAALVVATRLFTLAYAVFAESAGWKMPVTPMTDVGSYFGRDALGLVLTVLMIAIVGPFFEELVFRGVLLGWLQERVGAWPAVAASALVFAAFHMNAWQLVPVAVMGAACGWLALRSRSLWSAYALHMLYNAVPVLLVIFWSK